MNHETCGHQQALPNWRQTLDVNQGDGELIWTVYVTSEMHTGIYTCRLGTGGAMVVFAFRNTGGI